MTKRPWLGGSHLGAMKVQVGSTGRWRCLRVKMTDER